MLIDMYGWEMQVIVSLSFYYLGGPNSRRGRGVLSTAEEERVDAVSDYLAGVRQSTRRPGSEQAAETQRMLQQVSVVELSRSDLELFARVVDDCLSNGDPSTLEPFLFGATREQAVSLGKRLRSLAESAKN